MAESQKFINVREVQGWINKTHASWQAKESWVTRLSEAELKRMLGLQKPPQGLLDFESLPEHGRGPTSPSQIDWRNAEGSNWLGPVMNQGNCGSCVAFATVATLEARTSIAWGAPWLRPSFSPQALFACGGGGCETGWLPDDAAGFLQRTGVPDEACMPYTSGSTGEDVACSQKCSDADARATKIASYSMPSSYGGSVDAVKDALKKGPLVTTLTVFSDFVTYGGGVYKHVGGSYMGGHAVSLVGFDDVKRAWLIRNSWGAEWGENGFAWISWDDTSGIASDTWALDVSVPQVYLAVAAPLDREYVSGTYRLVAHGQGTKSQDVRFRLKDSDGRDTASVACATPLPAREGEGCSAMLDTTGMKQGRYEIFAESAANPGVVSQARQFFVINSEPQFKISFSPASGTNLNKPLSGRPEFLVNVDSSPVPLAHIEFRAINSMGQVAAVKSNDYVLANMRMGWRTMTVQDGQYRILFHGELKFNGKTYAVDSNSFTVNVKN